MKTRLCTRCLFSLIIASTLFLQIASCQNQLQWSITIRIEVFAEGSASWVIQQETSLITENDESAFFQYSNMTSVDEFSSHVRFLVNQASIATGRSMRAQDFEVKAAVLNKPLGKAGTIQYQYNWVGFAEKVGDCQIKIGDAFSGELDLSQNDMLTVQYPSGYHPSFVDPPQDETNESERTLTWHGPENFGSGEPIILLEKSSSSWLEIFYGKEAVVSGIVAAVFAGLVGYWVASQRAGANKGRKLGVEPRPVSLSGLSIEDDEETVLRLLRAAGGRLYQSTITKECKFSKSKTSQLLRLMEKKGIITRKRKGRSKMVTLITKQDNARV